MLSFGARARPLYLGILTDKSVSFFPGWANVHTHRQTYSKLSAVILEYLFREAHEA